MTLYVYRIVVDSWPTPNGQPWARIYGSPHGQRYDHLNGFDDSMCGEEIPKWLEATINGAQGPESWRILSRVVEDVDRDLRMGVVMPKPNRKHYLSASGAHALARDMRAFGAAVRVLRSKPVEWVSA